MERDEITRNDFPNAADGYDTRSVDAHLVAVAAFVDSLRARVEALGVEIEALKGLSVTASESNAAEPGPKEAIRSAPAAASGPPSDEPIPSDDPVSARLVASKLHLDGLDRDAILETVVTRYRLEDPEGLVDDVIEGLS